MRVTNDKIHCATVDDRIGVYMMLYGLPFLGVNCDILLTDYEETGQSTGQWFAPEKDYNWMFQFDRTGADVVCYQYGTDQLTGALSECGFSVGDGLFSDISFMDHMGCCGFNVGCGMYDYHSPKAYVNINELLLQTALFRYFWTFYGDVSFPHDPSLVDDRYMWDWQSWDDEDSFADDLRHELCDYCGAWDYENEMHTYHDSLLCDGCHDWFVNGLVMATN
jgi:hypothetical protein